jgi:hypothetical protein
MAPNQRRLQSAETAVAGRTLPGVAAGADAQQTPYARGKVASRDTAAWVRKESRMVGAEAELPARREGMRR